MRFVLALVFALGCNSNDPFTGDGDGDGGFGDGDGDGDFGATPGGVQDMGLARELIAAGKVPPPEAFVVEGMFSEHELGLEGASCESLLCLRSAVAVAPDLAGERAAWFQVGMSSNINGETFERPSLTLIATVDVSGSMGWSYGEDQSTPASVAVELLRQVTAELGAADRVAIVTYGTTVRVALPLTSGDEQSAIQSALDNLDEGGSTNMEGGLREAYRLAGEAGGTAETRVMLFTDVRPNVGQTTGSEFEAIAASGADAGVGLTVFGLGLGLGQEVFTAMSHLRGGNAFSLFELEDTGELMADSWPFMVSPIAYDLTLEVSAPDHLNVAESFGIPTHADGSVGREVSTVFLSRRKGAVLVRLDGAADSIADGFEIAADLSYETLDGSLRSDALAAHYSGEPLDPRGQWAGQTATAKTVALAILVDSMRDAATVYRETPDDAIAIMRAATDRITGDAEALADPALDPEVALSAALLELMEQGAEQGDFYPR
jgi:Ca-activated chloride channel family protein